MTDQPLSKKTVNILGKSMAYHEHGEGMPVLFLHGNPTSSYLWRDVIPELHGYGRLIAPDLIGMGDSDKLLNPGPTTYTFSTHRDHLWAFIDAVSIDWAAEPALIRERVQSKVAVQGNLDPLVLIAGGAALDSAVDDVLSNYAGGRLIFNLGHGIQPETPIAHVEQMLKRVRAYRR